MAQLWRISKKTPATLANNSGTKKPVLFGLGFSIIIPIYYYGLIG